VEINEAKLVPFFGAGIGVTRNNFKDYSTANNPVIKEVVWPMYQIIVGIEFDLAEQLLFGIRCKLHGTFKDLKINNDYVIKYDTQYSIGLGFKYIL
jgi:hypothetical protein